MARVTVEDCILHVPNRFELVLLAAARAKQISSGNPLTIDRDNDKDAVVALREIAEETVAVSTLMEETISSFSKRRSSVEPERRIAHNAEGTSDVEEVFEDAKQHISGNDADASGLSFTEENVEVED